MNDRRLWAILMASVCLAFAGRTCLASWEQEFSKDGKSYKYVWRQYLDAQIVRTGQGLEPQVLALRSGLLQQKASGKFLDLRKIVGLWQTSLDQNGRVSKNEMVMDVTTHLLEKYKLNLIPPATLNAQMMGACGDSFGQIHVFLATPVTNEDGDFQNRLFYLRRKTGKEEEMITGPQTVSFPRLTAFSAGDTIYFYYQQNVKEPDPPLLTHSLPARRQMGSSPWRLFSTPGPYPLRGYDFTAFASGQDPLVVFREKGSAALSVGRWRPSRKSWDVETNAFSPRIDNTLVGDTLTGLSGFATAEGDLHVLGASHFDSRRQIVHIRRSGKENTWSCKAVMNQSADWVSTVLDAKGRIHLIGVNETGAIWYALGNGRDSWSFKGIVLDENAGLQPPK